MIFKGRKHLYLCIMDLDRYIELMTSHGVKPTANRIIVARTLGTSFRPLSMQELEAKIISLDKSSIFRALCVFKKKHLVHVIDDGSGGQRYELCSSKDEGGDMDAHPHFYCEHCNRTFCLDNEPMPGVTLPEGYAMRTVSLLVKGICPECSKNERRI